ncbi:hypothetical protein QTH87_19160 [Variovorax sp. J22P168]|uniref:hypothetical protein n=1 Tax=Variovorax jilinensis TaxID=3053513 RepID=UPI002574AFA3|nr:hypothetical protein [Variovorax sp. J22P168]MDM0014570.1 hypothetical protein [Variovorax sp. J22P168]
MPRYLAIGDSSGPLSVASASYYNPTGVLLAPGETYAIAADDGRWVDWHLASSADGRMEPSFAQSLALWALRCKQARWFQLVGAIGRNDNHLFPIGMHAEWTYEGQSHDVAPELCLFANDAWFAYLNNHGAVGVTVTRIR